jgi:hypothetical protein
VHARNTEKDSVQVEKASQAQQWFEKIQLRGYAQLRYNRLLETNPQLQCDQCDKSWGENGGFFFRRIRMIFYGDIHERVYFYIQPDFASGGGNFAQIRDAYFDLGLDANQEFRLRIGARLDLTSTSSGQTLLAFQAPERRSETLVIWGAGDKASALAEMEPELDAIRKKGHRIGDSLQLIGVRDISAPILGPNGDAIAVVTCPYLQRVDRETADEASTLAELESLASGVSVS